jgi:hypothetical protein
MQPVAHCPANDAAGEQIDDYSQMEPPLARPDVRDVHAHFWLGDVAVKSWSMMFGAIGQACSLSVVRLKRRFCLARKPFSRISRAVRLRPMVKPSPFNSRVIRGLP